MRSKENIAEELLERAIDVIEQHGEAGIRTYKIAADCGVTAPVLYRIYTNREGLIIAAQAKRYERALLGVNASIQAEVVERARACESLEEYMGMLEAILDIGMRPERHEARRVRMNVLGSAVTRPALLEEIARIDREAVRLLRPAFEFGLEKGWVSARFPLDVVMVWYLGALLGRFFVEINHDSFDGEAWNEISRTAVRHIAFGDA